MKSATRKPARLRNIGVTQLAKHLNTIAPEIELGWTLAIDEQQHAGWPTTQPDDDQTPHTGPPDPNPDALDYHDPTGEQACRLAHLDRDIQAMQNHWLTITKAVQALHNLTRRHLTIATPAIPACTISACHDPVESRILSGGKVSYVGMTQIAGQWVAKPGTRPICSRHRKQHQRTTGAG